MHARTGRQAGRWCPHPLYLYARQALELLQAVVDDRGRLVNKMDVHVTVLYLWLSGALVLKVIP